MINKARDPGDHSCPILLPVIGMVQAPVTVRTSGNGIVYRIRSAFGQRPHVVHLQIRYTVTSHEGRRVAASLTYAGRLITNPSDHIRVTEELA